MSELVYNTINMIIGKRGTGKTVYAKGDKSLGVEGLFNIYVQKGMKVLIVDTFDHPSYSEIPIITLDKINWAWKKGVYRYWCRVTDIPKALEHINENFWNGALFLEDAFKHQKEKLDRSMMNLIGDSKQKNVDMFFMYHNWGLAPRDLYRYVDYIEVFKTKDTPEERKRDLPGCYVDVYKAYQEVMADPSEFAHKTVDCG